MSRDIVLAKDIDDCSVCPLYKYDCAGGWTSDGGGSPIEPPCCSWDEDEEVYRGMYEYNHQNFNFKNIGDCYESDYY